MTGEGPSTASRLPDSSRGSLLVAAGIALSRVAGLIREITIAAFFGNSVATDAFSAAFRIPNILQNLLGEGVLSASFIPSYTGLLARGRTKEAGKVAGTILSLLILVTAALVLVGVFAADTLAGIFAPGFTGARRELTTTLIRVVTPGIGLLVLSAWCLGILNSHRRFFLSYVAPVLWNLAQIVGLLVAGVFAFTEIEGAGTVVTSDARGLIIVLAWATVAGAVLQLAVQIPTVAKLEPDLELSLHIDRESGTVLKRFLPVVGARGVVQLSALLDTLLASFLVVGAVSALRYGQVLYILPISVFGMSIAASELPELSSDAAVGKRDERVSAIRVRLRTGLARISYFVVPTALVYVVAGDLIVGTLLQRGEFERSDTVQVWSIIGAYGIGLVAATWARLLQSALYGIGDTTSPARASLARVGTSLVAGAILMVQFDQIGLGPEGLTVVGDLPAFSLVPAEVREAADTIPRLGAMGLALGVSVGSWVELRLLRDRLTRVVGRFDVVGGVRDNVLQAAFLAAGTTVVVRLITEQVPVFARGVLAVAAATITYLLASKSLGFPLARALNGRGPDRRPARTASARRSNDGGR
ncbi:murein biosynthesis integral membrane protein MurJ [Euzebya tangerina]|uniref:murein biosynthesis integral membrane protein MurJ n=1 Tax=Euzebya tangerina TaxID=591198 RepID=UPI0013C348AF|nr:murein biosynthesis integral membrane protein MurJ [Euzebya tangerina]